MSKTLLLSAAFVVGASGIGSATPFTAPAGGDPPFSPATHCKDKTTGQVQSKREAYRGHTPGAPINRGQSAMGGSGSVGMSGKEDTNGTFSSTSPLSRALADCLKG
jgi:hypothetical protein